MVAGLAVAAMPLEAATLPVRPSIVQKLMRDGEVPGLSFATIERGRIRQIGAYGVKNSGTGERVDDRTVFEAASLGKPVIAYAVMKLVDVRKLRLDAPIADYADGGVLAADPRWRQITVRMLLSHSSGLPNELMPGQSLSIGFEPGTRFSYSGIGFSLLQQAIEKATGLGFEPAMERLVFRPLGMRDSSFAWRAAYERQKAFGHNSIGKVTGRRKPDVAKASTLHTTATDYAIFLRAMLDRTGLSPASWREMTRAQLPVSANCFVCIGKDVTQHDRISWGLGWAIEQAGGRKLLFHWGENNGDFHAFVIGDPAARTGLVMFTNSGNGLSIAPALVAKVFPQSHPAFAWMGYDRYDSPARVVQKRIVQMGAARALARGIPDLTETQWNRIGYQLLGRGRTADAIAVFELNVRKFPRSANTYDSLGEAYLAAGDRTNALKNYRRSLELDPGNGNARDMIAKLSQ